MAMKQLFNKNGGGVIDIETSQIYENIERATMPHLEEVDWDVVIATQELIADTEFGNIIALKSLKAIMKSDIEGTASHALTILDSFFNYCGHDFQLDFIRYGLADKIFQNKRFSNKNTKRFIRLMNSWKKSTTNMEVRLGITKALDEINRKLDGYKLFVMELNNVAPQKVNKETERPTSKRQDIANRAQLMAIENNVSDASDEDGSNSMRHITSVRRKKERQEFEEDYRIRLRQQELRKPVSNDRLNSGPESSENDEDSHASKFLRHIKISSFPESIGSEITRKDSSIRSHRESSSARSHRSHRSTRKREESVDPLTGEPIEKREGSGNNSDGTRRSHRHRSHRTPEEKAGDSEKKSTSHRHHRSHRTSPTGNSSLNSAISNRGSTPDLADDDNDYRDASYGGETARNNETEAAGVKQKSTHHHRHRSNRHRSGRSSSHRSHGSNQLDGSNSIMDGKCSNPRVDGGESTLKHRHSHRKKDGNEYTSILDSDIQPANDEEVRPSSSSRKSDRRRYHRSKDGMDVDEVEPEMRNLSLEGKSRRTKEMAL